MLRREEELKFAIFAMTMDKRKIFVAALVISTILLSSFTFYFYQVIFTPNFLVDQENRYVLIPTGSDFSDVQRIVYDERIVNDPISFGMLSKFMDYDELVKPGRYHIEANSNNITVIRLLRSGIQAPVRITFNNARLAAEAAEKVCTNLEMNPEELLKLLESDSVAEAYGFKPEEFRSMFIPNTYEVYWNVSPKSLVDRFHREYEAFWNETRKQKAEAIGLRPVEVSVLASIVQAETAQKEELPMVAGLYLNRLRIHMPLQADPTLIYAVGDFTIKRVLNIHKEVESPYNTYKYAGLPPGTINYPSITSIDAVLNFSKHNYVYMCAKEDFSGFHSFASTLSEHNRNAARYQQALNKAKLYR